MGLESRRGVLGMGNLGRMMITMMEMVIMMMMHSQVGEPVKGGRWDGEIVSVAGL